MAGVALVHLSLAMYCDLRAEAESWSGRQYTPAAFASVFLLLPGLMSAALIERTTGVDIDQKHPKAFEVVHFGASSAFVVALGVLLATGRRGTAAILVAALVTVFLVGVLKLPGVRGP